MDKSVQEVVVVSNQVINIVATQCLPSDEEKFNRWYNEVHIPRLLKNKSLKGVARYKVLSETSVLPRYIAIYKFANNKDLEAFNNSSELKAAIQEMQETWGQKVEISSRIQYELIKEW